ncbi:MAG: DUF4115 domain-containing protein [Thermoleophilia bacterium]|nr:DUF4115 domain-containing protein [Thermoleophilia bacterium]
METTDGQSERMSAARLDVLRRARLESGLTFEEIAAAMEVRAEYLEALEKGELGRMLGPAYVRSIAVRYAVCLGIDSDVVGSPDLDWVAPSTRSLVRDAPRSVPFPVPPSPLPLSEAASSRGQAGARPTADPVFAPRRAEAAPRASRASSGGPRLGTPVLVGLLAFGLTLVIVFAALLLGFGGVVNDRLFGGGAETTASTVSEASTTPTAAVTTVAPSATDTGSTDAAGVFASTTTSAGVSTTASVVTTLTGAAAGSFVVTLTPQSEVWLEIRDEATEKALFIGVQAAGEPLRLEGDGPMTAVVGKPEVVSVSLDGHTVAAPQSQLWRLTGEGVEAR